MNNSNINENLQLAALKTLEFVGSGGIALIDQIAEYLRYDFSAAQIEEIIEYLIRRHFLAGTETGIASFSSKVAVYLTVRGRDWLVKNNAGARQLLTAGRPSEAKNNIKRAVYISESLICWNRYFEILKFFNQEQLLKKTNLAEINQYSAQGAIMPSGEADYLVLVRNRKNGRTSPAECKIALRYSPAALASIDPRIILFPASDTQAQKITAAGWDFAAVLNSVGKKRWLKLNLLAEEQLRESRKRNISEVLNETDRQLLRILRQSKMTFTVNDLSLLCATKKESAKNLSNRFNYSKNKLRSLGLINIRRGKVRPGYGFGAPADYLYLPENEKLYANNSGKCFQRHLVLGYLVREKVSGGDKLISFDPLIPMLTMNSAGRRIKYISDYADDERDGDVGLTTETLIEFRKDDQSVKLVVVDYNRYYKIIKKVDSSAVINLCADFDKFSS